MNYSADQHLRTRADAMEIIILREMRLTDAMQGVAAYWALGQQLSSARRPVMSQIRGLWLESPTLLDLMAPALISRVGLRQHQHCLLFM